MYRWSKRLCLWISLSPRQFEGTLCVWFQIQVELDLKYQPPEGATGAWAEEDFGTSIQDR